MAPPLGDFFPQDFKDSFAERNASEKCVLLIKIPEFLDITYPKYAIIACGSTCGNFFGLVCINTDKPFTGNCVTLLKSNYAFLSYDSHVSCDHISDMPVADIVAFLKKYPENILGEITDFEHIQILQKLKDSKVIVRGLKRKFDLL